MNNLQTERGQLSHHVRLRAEVMTNPTAELEEVTLVLKELPGGTIMLPVNACEKLLGAIW
ncbi:MULTISPECIES: hypothetical protein [unclassified Paenibacillus]|uniref:hypothetical protein n=1 Tax=unclassified Paenibacillus TaxID=185978 RepID=UPI002405DE89|nr:MULTISPECIES: hypothetical protein [unclassified Paenibacillus]